MACILTFALSVAWYEELNLFLFFWWMDKLEFTHKRIRNQFFYNIATMEYEMRFAHDKIYYNDWERFWILSCNQQWFTSDLLHSTTISHLTNCHFTFDQLPFHNWPTTISHLTNYHFTFDQLPFHVRPPAFHIWPLSFTFN
jgi:hypothetical protein